MSGAARLVTVQLRAGLATELQYRTNFAVQLLDAVINLATALGGVAVVMTHTSSLRGWSAPQLTTVVGVYVLMGGLLRVSLQPGLQRFVSDVSQGTFDFVLLKPVDAQFYVAVRRIDVLKLVDIVLGAAVLAVAAARSPGTTPGGVALFLGMLVAGFATIAAFWFMLATTAFWLINVGNVLTVFQGVYQSGRWPVSVYPAWLRWTLTFLIPVGFAVTVPADALAGRMTALSAVGAIVFAGVLCALSRWLWRRGLSAYSSASS